MKFVTEVEEEIKNLVELANKVRSLFESPCETLLGEVLFKSSNVM